MYRIHWLPGVRNRSEGDDKERGPRVYLSPTMFSTEIEPGTHASQENTWPLVTSPVFFILRQPFIILQKLDTSMWSSGLDSWLCTRITSVCHLVQLGVTWWWRSNCVYWLWQWSYEPRPTHAHKCVCANASETWWYQCQWNIVISMLVKHGYINASETWLYQCWFPRFDTVM